MSRVEAAQRLGVWFATCDRCGCTHRGESGVALDVYGDALRVPRALACSIACVLALVERRPDRYADRRLDAARWHRLREEWVRAGTRMRGREWEWDDTSSSRWIEENTARLRAAGEIA